MSDAPSTASQPASGLYAFAECELVDMKNGGVLLINRDSGAQFLVAPPVAQSMQLCRIFRTLEQHAEVLTASIPELAGQQADVMKVLGMVRDAGLMVSAEQVCERLNRAVPPALDLPATRGFIITCDRPEAVERLLETMLRSGNLSRHEALFLVDDSRDPANAARNRDCVEKFNLTCPRNMQYFGADEARALMDAMIAALPAQEEAIRFLLDRERWAAQKTYGLARNLCLLLSVGKRAVIMDDDVLCTTVAAPHPQAGLQFGQAERAVDFYQNPQDMQARTSRNEFDPLTGHAQCLGLQMGQAIGKLAGRPLEPADLAGANSAYLGQWDASSPVLITQSGTVGDPGTPGTEWIYTLERSSARRLDNFPGGLEGALASRCYWMGQARPTFSKLAVISQVTGLDNTALLPPYFPVFRGEDYLFGAMTEYLHPNAAVLEYDWNVPHLPLDARRGNPSPEPASGKGKFNVNKYITDRTLYSRGVSAAIRLQALAATFAALGETSDRDLLNEYRREVAQAQGNEFARLNAYLQDGSIRPPTWQDWLQRSVANLGAAMQAPALLTDISGIPAGMPEAEVLTTAREYFSGYARSLAQWDAIRAAASDAAASITD